VSGSWTLFAWGKRRNTVRERNNLVLLASTKLAQTQEEVQVNLVKADLAHRVARVKLMSLLGEARPGTGHGGAHHFGGG
jgi:hypothetical protein